VADPADLVREACTLLAKYFPQLGRDAAEPSSEGSAVPGMNARSAAAPLPGNPPAFYAYTSIWASARWAEELLLYAVGASSRDEQRGGSDDNTDKLLTQVIPKLAAGVDDDTYGLVLRELDQRVTEALTVSTIDEVQQWRPLPSRPCPYCRCFFLKVLLDMRGHPAGHIECFGHLPSGKPCRAAWASLAEIVPDLALAEGLDG
jgi:hypothetical protein